MLFLSCTRTVNKDSKFIVNNPIIHKQDSLNNNIQEMVLDSTAYNKNIIISDDQKTVYVFEMIDGKIDLFYKINAPSEIEEADWALFIMFVIILILLS